MQFGNGFSPFSPDGISSLANSFLAKGDDVVSIYSEETSEIQKQ
jgi:hypothetical protein